MANQLVASRVKDLNAAGTKRLWTECLHALGSWSVLLAYAGVWLHNLTPLCECMLVCPHHTQILVFVSNDVCHGSCCGLRAASIPRRLITKLGPNAQVPENQRPPVSMKTKPGEGPSTLVELLKSIPEAIVGRSTSRLTSSAAFLFLWRWSPVFQETNCICGRPQFPNHLSNHIPSPRIDQICAVFVCVQTMVWLPTLEILNMHTDVNTCDGARELDEHCKRLHWKLTGRKIHHHTGESETWPDSQPTELHPCPKDNWISEKYEFR